MMPDEKLQKEIDEAKKEIADNYRLEHIVRSLPHRNSSGMIGIPANELGTWRKGPALIGITIAGVLGIMGTMTFAQQSSLLQSAPVAEECRKAPSTINDVPEECKRSYR